MTNIKEKFTDFLGGFESIKESHGEWTRFITRGGKYDGVHPYGQAVFFTYLGRTYEDASYYYENYQ